MREPWARFVARPLHLAAALILGLAACKEPTRAPEAGAFLLRLAVAPAAPVPDEVRLSIYDNTGVLWKDVRFPDEGGLVPEGAGRLGSILIQPGTFQGDLRLHVRGLVQGTRTVEGILRIPRDAVSRGTFDLTLLAAVLADNDVDGVPDQIDDCPAAADPTQQGCLDGGAGGSGGAGGTGGPDAGDASGDAGVDAPSDVGDAPFASDGPVGADVPSGGVVTPDAGVTTDAGARPDADAGADGGADAGSRDAASIVDVRPVADALPDAVVDARVDATAPVDATASDARRANGVACVAATECRSEMCVDGFCCGTACVGPCRSCNQPGGAGTCLGHALGSDPEDNCPGATTCNGVGACGGMPVMAAKRTNAEICQVGTECRSGFCTDGVCCDNACTDACQSCATGACQVVRLIQDAPECVAPARCSVLGRCI